MKKTIINTALLIGMILTILVSWLINLWWMGACDTPANLGIFVLSIFFLIASVVYFIIADLKWSIPIIIFWILILIYGALCLLYDVADIDLGEFSMLFSVFINPPLAGISYLTGMVDITFEIAYIIISLGVLSIPVIRFRKARKSNV